MALISQAGLDPDRLRATYKRTHGIRYFHGCYDMSQDKLWGVLRRRKGGDHTLTAFKTIRAARPDGAPIYVILRQPTTSCWPEIFTPSYAGVTPTPATPT